MDIYTPEQVFNNPKLLPFELVNPDCLLVLEYKREELTKGGILLLDVTSNVMGQQHRLPKWKILKIGSNVEKELGVKVGDFIIVKPKSGKPHNLTGRIECRLIKIADVLAKVAYEAKDVAIQKSLDSTKKWTKL